MAPTTLTIEGNTVILSYITKKFIIPLDKKCSLINSYFLYFTSLVIKEIKYVL